MRTYSVHSTPRGHLFQRLLVLLWQGPNCICTWSSVLIVLHKTIDIKAGSDTTVPVVGHVNPRNLGALCYSLLERPGNNTFVGMKMYFSLILELVATGSNQSAISHYLEKILLWLRSYDMQLWSQPWVHGLHQTIYNINKMISPSSVMPGFSTLTSLDILGMGQD